MPESQFGKFVLRKLTLSKEVHFSCHRLSKLYSFALYLLILGLLYWAWQAQLWAKVHEFPNVVTSAWAHKNLTQAQVSMRQKLNQPICDGVVYEYQYDIAGLWEFRNATCKLLCDPFITNKTCFSLDDLAVQLPEGVLFTTSVSEEYFERTTPKPGTLANYLVPLEAEYSVVLSYGYHVTKLQTGKVSHAATIFRGSSEQTLTVLLDYMDQQKRTYVQNDITLSLLQLFDLAGKPHFLDMPQHEIGKNYLPNATFRYLPVRVTGRQIHVNVDCYSPQYLPRNLKIGDWTGNVCTMKIYAASPSWESIETFDSTYGITRRVVKRGVFVHVQSKAVLRLLDISSIVTFITQAFVLLGMLSKVFRCFVMNCLGHVSTIYRKALVEEANIDCMMANLGMDVMCSNLHFNHLKAKHDSISAHSLAEAFKQSFRSFTEVNDEEIALLTLHCFAMALSMCAHGKTLGAQEHLNKHVYDNDRSSADNLEDVPTLLMQREFLLSTHTNSRLPLSDALKIFEGNSRLQVLESYFAPRFMRIFHKKKHIIDEKRRLFIESKEGRKNLKGPAPTSLTLSIIPQNDTPSLVEDQGTGGQAQAKIHNRLDESEKNMGSHLQEMIRKHLGEFEEKMEARLQVMSDHIRLELQGNHISHPREIDAQLAEVPKSLEGFEAILAKHNEQFQAVQKSVEARLQEMNEDIRLKLQAYHISHPHEIDAQFAEIRKSMEGFAARLTKHNEQFQAVQKSVEARLQELSEEIGLKMYSNLISHTREIEAQLAEIPKRFEGFEASLAKHSGQLQDVHKVIEQLWDVLVSFTAANHPTTPTVHSQDFTSPPVA